MGLAGIRPGDQDTVGVFKLGYRVRHSARTKGGGQTGHCGTVSETGAVIYVVSPNHRASELLQQVIFFVCAFG